MWTDEANEGVSQGVLGPGESTQLGTFIGHTFFARSANAGESGSNAKVLDFMVVNGRSYVMSPQNRLTSCEAETFDGVFVPSKVRTICHR